MIESLAHVALAALTALSWFGLGSVVLAPFGRPADRALDALNRVGAGAVAFVLLTFAVGWVGLLYRAAYLPVFAAAAAWGGVLAAREVRTLRRPELRAWRGWERALLGLVVAYAAVAVAVACAPISSADALFHHAAAPELFAAEHRISELEWSWNSYQPYLVEMLVLDGYLLWDGVQGALAATLLGLAGTAAVAGAAARLFDRRTALLAGAVYGAQPFALWMTTSTFVEPAAAFMLALAAWNLLDYAHTRAPRAIACAGVFAGAAAGTKYFGAAAAGILAVAAAVILRRSLDLRRALLFALPALALALPWYVKNAILTGDPVYPLLRGWPNAEAEAAARESFDNYGYGRSLADLAALPFRLLADAERFDRGAFVSPLFLLFAPLALFRRRGRSAIAAVLAALGAYVLMWFAGVQDSRYLLIAMPVAGVLAAVGIVELARAGRAGRLAAVLVTAGALVAGAGVSAVYAAQFGRVVVGLESEDAFLRDNVSYHEGMEWMNEHLPPDAKVLLGHVLLLHLDREGLVWTADALPASAGPEETRAFFRRNGITHAAVLGRGEPRQLRWVGARRIARVPVRTITSRTLSSLGPPDVLTVYEVR